MRTRRETRRGELLVLEKPDHSRSYVIARSVPGLHRGTRLQLLRDVSVEYSLNEMLERKGCMLIDAQREARIGSWALDLERSLIYWTPEMRQLIGGAGEHRARNHHRGVLSLLHTSQPRDSARGL